MNKKTRWCVQHNDGWCACKENENPGDDVWNEPTLCEHFIALPHGIRKRKPTCPDCLNLIDALIQTESAR